MTVILGEFDPILLREFYERHSVGENAACLASVSETAVVSQIIRRSVCAGDDMNAKSNGRVACLIINSNTSRFPRTVYQH